MVKFWKPSFFAIFPHLILHSACITFVKFFVYFFIKNFTYLALNERAFLHGRFCFYIYGFLCGFSHHISRLPIFRRLKTTLHNQFFLNDVWEEQSTTYIVSLFLRHVTLHNHTQHKTDLKVRLRLPKNTWKNKTCPISWTSTHISSRSSSRPKYQFYICEVTTQRTTQKTLQMLLALRRCLNFFSSPIVKD